MKFLAVLVSLAVALAAPSTTRNLIIKLKPGASLSSFRSLMTKHNQLMRTEANSIKYEYHPKIFNGIAGTFTSTFVQSLKGDSSIEYIVNDGTARIFGSQQNPPSWGLRRISERDNDKSKPYNYPDAAGQGVDVYVVDTGVQANHTEFENRAKLVKTFVDGEALEDLNGHGTHCAGTIGSKTYGVAKKVNIFGVKVLNGAGSGTWSGVIAGISFAATDGFTAKSNPRVISMSLGGGKNQAVNDAVNNAYTAGVHVIVAAGNNYHQSACELSPAGADHAFAVAATDINDGLAVFSNTGPCVKIAAPGVDILSLWRGNDGATNTISGTSMATPHVAGAAAVYLSTGKYANVDALYKALQDNATPGKITGSENTNTTNLLLYVSGGNTMKIQA